MDVAARAVYVEVLAALDSWVGYPGLKRAMEEFREVDVYLAGGALRDVVTASRRMPKDFDFLLAGNGTADFIESLGSFGVVTTGPFGSPRWFPAGTTEHYADIVPVERFFNGLWTCENVVDTLNQFDFTANAIALDLRSASFFNPQNGVRDARARVMRGVRFDYPNEPISPECRLSRLSVLWTRLLHYASVLDFTIEPVTQRWLQDNARFRRDAELFRQTFFEPDLSRFDQ